MHLLSVSVFARFPVTLSTVADLSLSEFTAYALASDVALDLVIGSVRQIATQTLAALRSAICIKGLEEKKRFFGSDSSGRLPQSHEQRCRTTGRSLESRPWCRSLYEHGLPVSWRDIKLEWSSRSRKFAVTIFRTSRCRSFFARSALGEIEAADPSGRKKPESAKGVHIQHLAEYIDQRQRKAERELRALIG